MVSAVRVYVYDRGSICLLLLAFGGGGLLSCISRLPFFLSADRFNCWLGRHPSTFRMTPECGGFVMLGIND